MGGADVEDDAHLGRGDLAQVGDVPDAAGAHLGHQEPGVGLESGHRERQPDLVVEVAVRRDGRTGRLQDLSQQVLGRGLALRAGDGRDPQAAGAPAIDLVARDPAQRQQRILGQQARASRVRYGARNHSRHRPGRERGGHEVVSVGVFTREGDEERARLDQAGIDHQTGDHGRSRRRTLFVGAGRDLGVQQRGHVRNADRDHGRASAAEVPESSAHAVRMTSTSSKGRIRPPIS